jgi:hypothetical protein
LSTDGIHEPAGQGKQRLCDCYPGGFISGGIRSDHIEENMFLEQVVREVFNKNFVERMGGGGEIAPLEIFIPYFG